MRNILHAYCRLERGADVIKRVNLVYDEYQEPMNQTGIVCGAGVVGNT